MTAWIVKLESDCWIADRNGDPGRTCSERYAQVFGSRLKAEKALAQARAHRPFQGAEIIKVRLDRA